jgi:hypothetical protein
MAVPVFNSDNDLLIWDSQRKCWVPVYLADPSLRATRRWLAKQLIGSTAHHNSRSSYLRYARRFWRPLLLQFVGMVACFGGGILAMGIAAALLGRP